MIKYYRFTYDYVLWEISFANITMLLATIPTHDEEEEKEKPDNRKATGSENDGVDDLKNFLGL